jgi:integrase
MHRSRVHSWAAHKLALDARPGDCVREWTLHDLRRTAATRMADLGVPPHVIEEVLNHRSGHRGGVAGIYNRSRYEREVKSAVAMWDRHLTAMIEGREQRKWSRSGPPMVTIRET